MEAGLPGQIMALAAKLVEMESNFEWDSAPIQHLLMVNLVKETMRSHKPVTHTWLVQVRIITFPGREEK